MTAMTNPRGNLAGRTYLERGRPVLVLASWRTGTGDRCPRNVMIRYQDGAETVRPFRGLRRGLTELARRDSTGKIAQRGVEDSSSGCWLWTGSIARDGYGRVYRVSGTTYVHRQVWELLIGLVPSGIELDHLCRVRCCCNPFHLEPVTGRENKLRGETLNAANLRKTHCPRGHAYDYQLPDGRRWCRECDRARKRTRTWDPAVTCKRLHRWDEHGYVNRQGKKVCRVCNRDRQRLRRQNDSETVRPFRGPRKLKEPQR